VIGKGGSFSSTGSNSSLTLKSFLASLGTNGNSPFGMFIGKYAFIYSDSGWHIIAFSFPEGLVMAEP
jgi:hypothetical protein